MVSASETLLFVMMMTVEFSQIGLATLSKAAFQSGLDQFVYIVYYDALGTIILLPWLICRWISGKKLPITFPLLYRFFILSLIGIEKLDLRKSTDQIKALGAFLAVLGALVVSLYKGPALLRSQGSSPNSARVLLSEQSNWPIGCLIITVSVLLRSLWSILQADTVKSYPDEVAIVFFYTLFGTIQAAAASFFFVEGQSAWQLHSKIEVISTLYAAFALSLLHNTAVTWCLHKKGPIYVSMFSPLGVAIAAVMGFVFLDDGIYLDSVTGSAAIVVGFYAVMWGQAKTKNAIVKDISGLESLTNQATPLLQSSDS